MKKLDRILQSWRISKVEPYLTPDSEVLDIGCSQGELFEKLGPKMARGVGIDPHLTQTVEKANYRLIPGRFPLPEALEDKFDVITILAVLEHVPIDDQKKLARQCLAMLKPEGVLLITVPSPYVDPILDALKAFKALDGMDLEEHYGFEVASIPSIYQSDHLRLKKHEKFQLGLNNFFVFEKTGPSEHASPQDNSGLSADLPLG